ncbi:MAG: hypothetical protein Q9183_007314, partial [Haloplaca sp. 2 TL-2023]
DNPINQKIAVSFVTKLGFKSEAFSDGLQAVEAIRRKSAEGDPFHLVLMDVQMPVLDGYDATRLISKDSDPTVRGVLIVAMTASAIRGDREKCIDAGMNNYLAKPVRANVLKTMLEGYLSQDSKQMVGLQETANEVAREAVAQMTLESTGERSGSVTASATTNGGERENGDAVRELMDQRVAEGGVSNGLPSDQSNEATGEETMLAQRPRLESRQSTVQEWPQAMRPAMRRGEPSSADSLETVTTVRGGGDGVAGGG